MRAAKPWKPRVSYCFVTWLLLHGYLILELVNLLGCFRVEELDRCSCKGICINTIYRFSSLPGPLVQAVHFLNYCYGITSIFL